MPITGQGDPTLPKPPFASTRPARAGIALALVLFVAAAPENPQPNGGGATLLGGLDRLYVQAAVLSRPARDARLDEEFFVQRVSLAVGNAGFLVLSIGEEFRPEIPHLVLTFDSVEAAPTTTVYHVSLELREDVTLERAPSLVATASTWWSSRLGVVPTSALPDEAPRLVEELVRDFLTDSGRLVVAP